MVHEIGHMFGIPHCIHYECTMNGSNGPGDGADTGPRTLCGVCLLKLKVNFKFDTKVRYEGLVEASNALGLTARAERF